jgi:hypothetical protein
MGYQLGAWDPETEAPTVAMDAFLGISATGLKPTRSITGYNFNVYPNPFNPSTTIEYGLPIRSNISIVIYNVLGQKVKGLVSGDQSEGEHDVIWSATDVPSGVYFCRMMSGDYWATKQIVLIK